MLSESEASANTDRRALRSAGYLNCRFLTNGSEAARLIADSSDIAPDIVICTGNLADMDGTQFCAIMRQHPALKDLPILLIIPNNSEIEHLKALDCGASAIMPRPYSVEDLRKQIEQLNSGVANHRRRYTALKNANSDDFETALVTNGVLLRSEKDPAEYFKLGMRLLGENHWPLAIAAFEKALRDTTIKAEVEMGMAAAYRGKGDQSAFRLWLGKATETFVMEHRWNRARSAYAKLLQIDPKAKNPFLSEAHRQIRLEQYRDAAIALVQGHNLIPKMQISERYASLCFAAKNTEKMYDALQAELDLAGEKDYLGDSILNALQAMQKAREERQKEQAEERAWKLAKNMGWQDQLAAGNEEIKAEFMAAVEQSGLSKSTANKNLSAVQPQPQDKKIVSYTKQNSQQMKENFISLQEENEKVSEFAISTQAEDDLFQGKSLLSDFWSMMRLTWRLNKRAKKRTSN